MGGLTYLFGFFVNSVLATIIAGIAAIIAAALPARRTILNADAAPASKAKRATMVFVCAWLLLMLYGCVEMFRTHHQELTELEGAGVVPGLIDTEDQVLRAERVSSGDSAQTYVKVRTTVDAVRHIADMQKLRAGAYDAHTVRDRGWQAPAWWPEVKCQAGVTYDGDPFDASAPSAAYTLNWCPAERIAYVQRFDY